MGGGGEALEVEFALSTVATVTRVIARYAQDFFTYSGR